MSVPFLEGTALLILGGFFGGILLLAATRRLFARNMKSDIF